MGTRTDFNGGFDAQVRLAAKYVDAMRQPKDSAAEGSIERITVGVDAL
jgi:hypothetical protein